MKKFHYILYLLTTRFSREDEEVLLYIYNPLYTSGEEVLIYFGYINRRITIVVMETYKSKYVE